MKNPYSSILGATVLIDEKRYYVAFIEPDKGVTCKGIDDDKDMFCMGFYSRMNYPVDMSTRCVTDEHRILLDKEIRSFYDQVKKDGSFTYPKQLSNEKLICPSRS